MRNLLRGQNPLASSREEGWSLFQFSCLDSAKHPGEVARAKFGFQKAALLARPIALPYIRFEARKYRARPQKVRKSKSFPRSATMDFGANDGSTIRE